MVGQGVSVGVGAEGVPLPGKSKPGSGVLELNACGVWVALELSDAVEAAPRVAATLGVAEKIIGFVIQRS